MAIAKVGVVGCGLMGSGIAQVAASSGYQTVVREVERGLLDKGLKSIEASLDKFVEKGKMSASDRQAALSRLKPTIELGDLADCDLIIEAITENLEAKRQLFSELDRLVKREAIFASNTSSLSITEMMTATDRRERFIGLHFFNPVPIMGLVEVVRTIATDEPAAWARCRSRRPTARASS